MNTFSYTEFCTIPLPEKVKFFDNGIVAMSQSVEKNQLYKLLKQIILNVTENAFVRKSAISTLVEFVFLGKIQERQAVTILVDEWEISQQIFVEVQRIKDLFYFCNLEPDIQEIYTLYLTNEELEIVTEAQLNLGLIHLQKGFQDESKINKINSFEKAYQYFKDSDNHIENRIDAKFYRIVVSILLDFLNQKNANIDNQLHQLSEILKEKWLNSVDFKENIMDVSFFRSLTSISNIIKENPNIWIEYPTKFKELHLSYIEIQNQAIKKRLNQSALSQAFIKMSNNDIIEPYFALNFQAQIVKIDNCILQYQEGSPIYDFLMYIRSLAVDKDFSKKKVTETIEQKFKNCFSQRSNTEIEKAVKGIKDTTNLIECLDAFDMLNSPSIEKFINTLVASCLKLQANRVFRGVNGDYSEDDRNTYISDLLDIGGYQTKDQTRQGTSQVGKSAGEIDILIKDTKGLPFAIIEALNWRDWDYLKIHIDKLFNNYDTAGFENNFIVVYSNVQKFAELCRKYFNYISNEHKYKYPFESIEELKDYLYTDLKIYRTQHIRQENKVFLYHIIINFSG